MADILREMDPMVRASIAIFLAVMLKGMLAVWWGRYKLRQELKPHPTRLRNGVYEPWGPIDRLQRIFNIAVNIWIVTMALLLVVLIYMKATGATQLL